MMTFQRLGVLWPAGFLSLVALLSSAAAPAAPPPSDLYRASPGISLPRAAASASTVDRRPQLYGKLPLSFERNQGEADRRAKFLARGPGYTLFLTPNGSTIRFERPSPINLRFENPTTTSILRLIPMGTTGRPYLVGVDRLPGTANFLLGADPRHWHTDTPTYARVEYRGLYPGIDLAYYGSGRQIEYDWVVAPRADPHRIRLRFEGARSLHVDGHGDLAVRIGQLTLRQRTPLVYQRVHGQRHLIAGSYALARNGEIGLRLGRYDPTRALVVDPVLLYSDILGGSSYDYATRVAVDAQGDAYVTGATASDDFPTVNPAQPTNGGRAGTSDAFVTKLNASGTALLYSTYLGGSSDEEGSAIAVDGEGNAYVAGYTGSSDFPSVAPLKAPANRQCNQDANRNGDAFVAELSPEGDALIFSVCLGGKGADWAGGIALDGARGVYVAGSTTSTDFPTVRALQATSGGGKDVFVAKLDPVHRTLVFSTYLGGSGDDDATGIAVDGDGYIYASGFTNSTNFPVTHALQSSYAGGSDIGDAFLVKLSPDGGTMVYSTYLGGTGDDAASDVAVDVRGNAYITGTTNSTDYPTLGPLQNSLRGVGDAFVAKVDPAGRLLYSTYLGGAGQTWGNAIAVDGAGDAYVAGATSSTDFPGAGAPQATYRGGFGDAYIAELDPTGRGLIFSSYLGGTADDIGTGIALDSLGNSYLVGGTSSTDFPTTPGTLSRWVPRGNAFVAKIGDLPANPPPPAGQSIAINSVEILHRVAGRLRPTSLLHLNETMILRASYSVSNAGSNLPSGRVRIVRSGRIVYQGTMVRTGAAGAARLFQLSSRLHGTRLIGHDVVHVILTLGSAHQTRSIGLTVKLGCGKNSRLVNGTCRRGSQI